jgi:hypothetical protein
MFKIVENLLGQKKWGQFRLSPNYPVTLETQQLLP